MMQPGENAVGKGNMVTEDNMFELLLTHQPLQRLGHIEKHVAEVRRLIGVILGDGRLAERLGAVSALSTEFRVISGDAECALLCLGDSQEK
jgi:hypothetical protein